MVKKIGVLLPQSNQFPLLAKEFMNGLKLSLSDKEYSFVVEGIGFGNDTNSIINSIQKLVNQEDVLLLTGYLGHKGINEILKFVNSIDETLIYADAGATRPIDLSEYPKIFCNSLDLYKATQMLGKFLVDSGYSNVMSSSSYYDSGYGFIEAMGSALYENGNAQFSGHYITPLHPRDIESEIIDELILNDKPDAIFAYHSGIYAKEHAEFVEGSKLINDIPIYALPFSVEPALCVDYPEVFNGMNMVLSWHEEFKTQDNIEFIKLYKERFSKNPSIFSVLGYENGLLIQETLNTEDFSKVRVVNGPRGELDLNSELSRVNPNHYICTISQESDRNKLRIRNVLEYDTRELQMSEENAGGWDNAYLCS